MQLDKKLVPARSPAKIIGNQNCWGQNQGNGFKLHPEFVSQRLVAGASALSEAKERSRLVCGGVGGGVEGE